MVVSEQLIGPVTAIPGEMVSVSTKQEAGKDEHEVWTLKRKKEFQIEIKDAHSDNYWVADIFSCLCQSIPRVQPIIL